MSEVLGSITKWPNIMYIGGGIFCIIASINNWNWVFASSKSWLIVSIFGREGARIVYFLLGIGLIIFGSIY